jgi:hypothetical protein
MVSIGGGMFWKKKACTGRIPTLLVDNGSSHHFHTEDWTASELRVEIAGKASSRRALRRKDGNMTEIIGFTYVYTATHN